ncbi:hypothetical protein CesoFtcFv8_008208 [Champsocephalus esox]|uniref:3-oxo-5alpha-steroid 4-dehydrogenase (NADP(+)) n=1 Tax=Champsocephalus esox TaxID=159716 RepID=A0AAN8C7T9_9TELE|nr:hypothetical protein CesoFtcFv8_008208 [Champsocephalus esox]
MECCESAVSSLSWALVLGGPFYLLRQTRTHTPYGRYRAPRSRCCPARLAWFLQEAPALLLPLMLLLLPGEQGGRAGGRTGGTLLICTFMLHYFHRSCIYALRTRGQPVPLDIVLFAAVFCALNGFLQAHSLLHCTVYPQDALTQARMAVGLLLFLFGMTVNIHSDNILRKLRRPGETVYRIPHGGLFEFVSGANFLGEILEWIGFAVAAGSFPAFAFAFFTVCSIGPRACHHHRDYLKRFEDYPRCRRAIVPFLL